MYEAQHLKYFVGTNEKKVKRQINFLKINSLFKASLLPVLVFSYL